MDIKKLSLVATHCIAITQHAFTIQCGEFATALASEEDNDLSVQDFDLSKHLSQFDFQSMLDSGYKEMEGLHDSFIQIAEHITEAEYQDLLTQLPQNLPSLSEPLTGGQLKQWVVYALSAEAESPLYRLQQMCTGNNGFMDDSLPDLIREAIAFDKTEDLESLASVNPKNITIDDLNTAAMIQSFKAFSWMLNHATLSNNDLVGILAHQIESLLVSTKILPMLKSSSPNPDEFLTIAQSLGLTEVCDFLRAQK